MGLLFDTTPQNITIHIKNIFESGEFQEITTCKEFLQVRQESDQQVSHKHKFYNLGGIICDR